LSALSDVEKVEIRRQCGYPVYGAAPDGMQTWRFFQAYGLLEYRMNNLSDAETAVTRRYLLSIASLEIAVPGTSDNLDTERAGDWTHNPSEFTDRTRLLDNWRRRLCGFLGVPAGPALGTGTPTLVV
jgi:hypothetical protein